MAFVVADRVKEKTLTGGTGDVTLTGAVDGFQAFGDVMSDGDTTYYAIGDLTNNAFEVGVGTYTTSTNTLSRDTVLSSSNAGSLVNFTAEEKDVFITLPSSKSLFKDTSDEFAISNVTGLQNALDDKLAIASNLSDLANAATARTNLGVAIGTDVLAYDANLQGFVDAFTLPTADGTDGQVLTTDGAGGLTLESLQSTFTSVKFTATTDQTTFTTDYTPGAVNVYYNGVLLVDGTDYLATNGTSVVLQFNAVSGDSVEVQSFGTFDVADTYTQGEANSTFLQIANNLSDLNSAATARTNLGLGTMAVETATDYLTTADASSTYLTQANASSTYLTQSSASSTYAPLAGATFTGNVLLSGASLVEDVGVITSEDIDLDTGNYFAYTATGNATLTVSNTASSGSVSSFILQITNGGAHTISFGFSPTFAGGSAPTLTTSGTDILGFFTTDGGTTWRGLTLALDIS